ncbi:hypothetical protein G9A89_015586 [Geosiphon pyriformis]|nr:hypothetical protein G9A89_015586 [Geosiphon pyriformis]
MLGENFNENSSRKSASFKFCSDLGLVNSFAGYLLVNASTWNNSKSVERVIDFIFVSKSLSFMVVGHQIEPASDFFNTNHSVVLVSIGLGGLLDTSLNSECKQANRDRFLVKSAKFNSAKVDGNLDTMWAILKNVVVGATDKMFSRYWFSKFNCLRNKHLSKFFKLELLVAKLMKCLRLSGSSEANCLIRAWSIVDEKEASNFASLDSILHHLSNIKKKYCRSKYFESKVAKDILIRKAIEKYMENFYSNKEQMIRSVLECLFYKIVLEYLIVNDNLILLPNEVKSMSSQYAPLDYVNNNAFCDVISNISSGEFFQVIKSLFDKKAADLSGIPNEL